MQDFFGPTAHTGLIEANSTCEQDLDGLLQELTAIYPYEVLLQLYEEAVNDQAYSFLFINKKSKGRNVFQTL